MIVKQLLSQVRNPLQDSDKTYWDDSELLSYYNECKRSMASERLEIKTTASMLLDTSKNEYNTDGILRYIKAKDDEGKERKLYPNDGSGDDDTTGIIIKDYNVVYVNDPTIGTTIIFDIVSFPEEDNLESNVRLGDESALKYYILSKAYEKESDMESFQKSSYFYSKYRVELDKLINSSSINYKSNIRQVKSYYY